MRSAPRVYASDTAWIPEFRSVSPPSQIPLRDSLSLQTPTWRTPYPDTGAIETRSPGNQRKRRSYCCQNPVSDAYSTSANGTVSTARLTARILALQPRISSASASVNDGPDATTIHVRPVTGGRISGTRSSRSPPGDVTVPTTGRGLPSIVFQPRYCPGRGSP